MILNFQKWKKLFEQGTNAPKYPAASFTHPENDTIYKYPFGDVTKFDIYFKPVSDFNSTQEMTALLKTIMPDLGQIRVGMNKEGQIFSGNHIISGIRNILDVFARFGVYPEKVGRAPIDTARDLANGQGLKAQVDAINKMVKIINQYQQSLDLDPTKAIAKINTFIPTLMTKQLAAAGLPTSTPATTGS